ncbi:SDR family NAD(P)-dependent oxidoreductase [Nocardiopsis coralliicola]
MTQESAPLTAASTVGEWLDDPRGARALQGLLEQAGVGADSLAPVRSLPLAQLAEMSGGALGQETLDDLVRQVNGGVLPEAEAVAGWRERIVPERFAGRTVIVTGAASGIGRATASRVAREGGRVIAVDVAGEGLDRFAADHADGDVVPVRADLTRADDIAAVTGAAGGRIDGLANVAGISDDFAPLHEVADDAWERVFAINVDGLFRLTRAVLPAMLEAKRGSVVNVASEAGIKGSTAGTAYTASKHAVVGITRSASFMYGASGIRVNAVAPGGVATGISPGGGTLNDFGRGRTGPILGTIPPIALPEHLAASITFLLSDDGINVNGAILPSDGGWSVQ